MDKRSFIRFGLAGSAAGIIVPKMVFAAAMDTGLESKYAGGIYYTKEEFGRWNKGLADAHLPDLDKQISGRASQLQVATNHPMDEYKHYIIKHQLLNSDFDFMEEHLYDPTKDKKPVSTFDLGSYRGPVYVMTMCNVHDVWMNVIEV